METTGTGRRAAGRGSAPPPAALTITLILVVAVAFGAWIAWAVASDQPLDFNVYYLAAEAYARHQDPYAISDAYPSPQWDALAADVGIDHFAKPYRYPPQTAVLVMALRPLGPRGAVVVWDVLNGLAFLAGAVLLGVALGGGRLIPICVAALGLCLPAYDTLMLGQINGLIFLSVVAALWALLRGRELLAGGSVAVGSVLKLVPFLLVPYLALRRRWRLVAGAGAGIVLLTLVCLPVIGWSGLAAYWRDAVNLTRPSSVFLGEMNQTLSGVLGRALPHDLGLARTLARIAALLLLAATGWSCRPRGDATRLLPLEFGMVIALTGLIFPFTWYHQLVLLLVPGAVVAQELWRRGRRWALAPIAALAALAELHWFLWAAVGPFAHTHPGTAWLAFFPFLLGLTLWGISAALLEAEKRRPRAAETASG